MKTLAQETSALCKFSGLVTEAAPDWTETDLKPYVEHLLEVFGPDRLIWGFDWPVCTLAASYDAWRAAAESLTANSSGVEKAAIFGGSAEAVYRLQGFGSDAASLTSGIAGSSPAMTVVGLLGGRA